MAVRLKDIAQDLGVSVVTVSKVLHQHPDISEETRERVLKRMQELNYRPNMAARALVTGRSYVMAVVVPDLVHPFFGQVARALSNVLRPKGYKLLLSSTEDDPELEREEIEELLARRVDALIIASSQRSLESFQHIEERKTPYILIDRRFEQLQAHFVGVDDVQVGRLVTGHLVDVGCRRIAHIGGPDVSTAAGRMEGYQQVMAERGLPILPGYVIRREHGDDAGDSSGYQAMRRMLSLPQRPDGVFCYNDPTALGAMKAIFEAGLEIPGDIAIAGCGNVTYADLLRVPLTSVDQQSARIGEHTADLALTLLGSKQQMRPKQILLEPQLVARASTMRGT